MTATTRRRSIAALATGALLPLSPLMPLAPPAEAATAAGSIVFIKDHNVWVARGDGSGARQISTDGSAGNPYRNPSQSDTGLIAAASYAAITTFDQQGNVIAEIDPPALPGSGGHSIDGTPVAVAVSPNGTMIAYSFAEPCGPGCGYRTATGYIRSSGAGDPAFYGTTFLTDPAWVSNTRTLQSGGFGKEVEIHDLGQSTQRHWFDDGDIYPHDYDFGDVDVSPDGRMIAGVGTYSVQQTLTADLFTLRISGNVTTEAPPRWPDDNCRLSDTPGVALTDPTWGPDSKTLAFERQDGIVTYDGTISPCTGGTERLIAPGGTDPDWAGIALSAPEMIAMAAPTITGSPTVGGTLTTDGGLWTTPPTGADYQWLRDGVAIAGATTQSYVVTAADAGHRLTVSVTVTRAGWPNGSASSAPVSIPAVPGGGGTPPGGGGTPPGGGGTPPGGGGTPPGGGGTSDVKNTRLPAITGKALVGRTVRATQGVWAPTPTKVTYQWLRDGKAIKRATRAAYRITKSDRRHRLTVRVTAILGGSRAAAVSKPVTVRR